MRFWLLIFAVGIALSQTGCGPLLDATVTGIVTLDGKPLSQGEVVFHPIDKKRAQMAVGKINPDGSYKLFTAGMEGALNGEYKITIVASNGLPATAESKMRKATLTTPLRYSLETQSPERRRVKSGPNVFPLKLKSGEPASRLPGDHPPLGEET